MRGLEFSTAQCDAARGEPNELCKKCYILVLHSVLSNGTQRVSAVLYIEYRLYRRVYGML